MQRGLDEARLAEWKKWHMHSAADVISAQEAARWVMEGAEEIGTQWVEVDRNEKIRVESEQTGEAKHVPMNLKSRLVSLGNQEKREMRSDSPTTDTEGIHLVFSFASSRKAKVRCGDLESTYFTGERMSRVLLLRQPRSGLPGLKPHNRLLARMPVYGTQDAGRGFWKKFRRTLIAGGVRENRVMSAVYTLTVDGQLRGIVVTHVDDLLRAFDGPVGQGVIDHIKQHLILSKESECNFSFCGREVRQDVEKGDYSVRVTCEATTLKIHEIRFEGNHVQDGAGTFDRVRAGAVRERDRITTVGGPHCARRVSGSREQTTADEETSDGGRSCLCEQGPPISQEDCHLRFDVSDGNHQLAPGRFCDWQHL